MINRTRALALIALLLAALSPFVATPFPLLVVAVVLLAIIHLL